MYSITHTSTYLLQDNSCTKVNKNLKVYKQFFNPFYDSLKKNSDKRIWIYNTIFFSFIFSDWNELFTTKCVSCGFPIEAGDRWVEALNNNYHSQCFNCTVSLVWIYKIRVGYLRLGFLNPVCIPENCR